MVFADLDWDCTGDLDEDEFVWGVLTYINIDRAAKHVALELMNAFDADENGKLD